MHMVLAMSRPYRHPKTGIYWLRKRVPVDISAKTGREVITKSLGTHDPEEAKRKHAELLAELEAEWAGLRRGKRRITDREAYFLAKPIGDAWLERFRENPSEQFYWHTDIYRGLWTDYPLPETAAAPGVEGSAPLENFFWKPMHDRCYREAELILHDNGFDDDILSLTKMAKAVGAALQKASLSLKRQAEGEFDPGDEPTGLSSLSDEERQPALILRMEGLLASKKVRQAAAVAPSHTLTGLVEDWWQESKAAGRKPSTYESYRNTFSYFVRYLGHDDVSKVTQANVIGFKDHRLSTPSPKTGKVPSAKTVKDSDLSALKAVFDWAVRNGRCKENPATGVTIKLAKPPRLRSKGLTDDEAKALLSAARALKRGNEREKTFAAKRWVPWLFAFTGARVGELGQLRKQDVFQRDDIWIIRITPEAGTVKTNEAREIPLHQQVVDLGFPDFVAACADGHLFLNVEADANPLGALQGLKNRLAEFGRTIVKDTNVAPNHGWRHRFKTVGMEAGIPPRILDAIQGQAARTVADTYGDVTLKTMAAEIWKLPYYHLPDIRTSQ